MGDKPEEQSVADSTEADAQQQSVEAGGAQEDSLDSLLAEWEKEAEGSKTEKSEEPKGGQQQTEKPSDEMNEVLQYVRQRQQEEQAERTNKDVSAAVEMLKEGWDNAPHERLLKGELYRAASEDPRFLEAFQRRQQAPERWQRTLKALQRELQAETGVDTKATSDRNAVTAAVRSASKAPPPSAQVSEKDISQMSDAEFERFRRGL